MRKLLTWLWQNPKKVLFIGMIVYGIYDFGLFALKGEVTTISQVMTDYLDKSILGVIVFCLIFGHWLWPMKVKVEVPVYPDYTRLKKAFEVWKTIPLSDVNCDEEQELYDAVEEHLIKAVRK